MKTVLLIEDNNDIRENMGEILELAGYNVLLAPEGKQGVAMAIDHKPDIIICDIMMPELDGYGVIHMLQKNQTTQSIPFIFLTAKSERAEMRKGMELGADDYITKPFSGAELLNAIEARLKKTNTAVPPIQSMDAKVAAQEKESLMALVNRHDVYSYSKKQKIYTERHHAFRLFYIVSGKVKTYKTNEDGKELVTGLYGNGDFLGYIALLEDSLYKESAEAIESSSIIEVPKEEFEGLINNNTEVAYQFISLLAGNVTEKEEQLLSLAYSSLRRKVADTLIKLLNKYREDPDSPFSIKLSRENLASIAGTAKESLIRTLSDFKEERLIEIKDGDVIILDEKKLKNMLN